MSQPSSQPSKLQLSHIAIAVPEIQAVLERFAALSMEVERLHDVPTEKVKAAMLPVGVSPHFRIELLEPSAAESPIAKFLTKRPGGGLHHICFEVKALHKWEELLKRHQFEILPPGIRPAARGKALFIHPKSVGGVLVELEEIIGDSH